MNVRLHLKFKNNSHKISFYFFCNNPKFYARPRLRFKYDKVVGQAQSKTILGHNNISGYNLV